jgi:hypothetical protein
LVINKRPPVSLLVDDGYPSLDPGGWLGLGADAPLGARPDIIDRDWRTAGEKASLYKQGILALPVNEVEGLSIRVSS